MKLKEHAEAIAKLMVEGWGDLQIVCSSDDEGNEFSPVAFAPMLGHYDSSAREFTDADEDSPENAVCIN